MAPFVPGDRVHVRFLGTGTVVEVRNGGRYLVELKGRAVIVMAGQLEPADPPRPTRDKPSAAPAEPADVPSARPLEIDLHGMTVPEALDALDVFLNDALLDGAGEAFIIHGRSGGRLKAAVHARLAELPSVRAFRVDPRNPGATIVRF